MPSAALQEALVSRHASHVCPSSIATPSVEGIIGQRIKKLCKQRAAEHDEALFKDPPTNEDCPICFLPMPKETILCASLPPATISSVPIYDFACANKELATKDTETYYSCCGNSICKGCVNSCRESGNDDKCPFCNSDRCITSYEAVEEIRSRAAANDPTSMILLGHHYFHGKGGIQRDQAKAIELYAKAVDLGHGKAHFHLADVYYEGGDMKKAKFHWEAAAMAGHDNARINLGILEVKSGNRAIKHWTIASSSGHYNATFQLKTCFEEGFVSRESINSTLTAYNNSCAEMRSKAMSLCHPYTY